MGRTSSGCVRPKEIRFPAVDAGFDAAIVYGGVQSANRHAALDYVRREIDWVRRTGSKRDAPISGCAWAARFSPVRSAPRSDRIRRDNASTDSSRSTPRRPAGNSCRSRCTSTAAHNEGFECPPKHRAASAGRGLPPPCVPLPRQRLRTPVPPGMHAGPDAALDGSRRGRPSRARPAQRAAPDSRTPRASTPRWERGSKASWTAGWTATS